MLHELTLPMHCSYFCGLVCTFSRLRSKRIMDTISTRLSCRLASTMQHDVSVQTRCNTIQAMRQQRLAVLLMRHARLHDASCAACSFNRLQHCAVWCGCGPTLTSHARLCTTRIQHASFFAARHQRRGVDCASRRAFMPQNAPFLLSPTHFGGKYRQMQHDAGCIIVSISTDIDTISISYDKVFGTLIIWLSACCTPQDNTTGKKSLAHTLPPPCIAL